MKWYVEMLNESGEKLDYVVEARTSVEALQEAWRLYRDLDYRDDEMPPKWTKAKASVAMLD